MRRLSFDEALSSTLKYNTLRLIVECICVALVPLLFLAC